MFLNAFKRITSAGVPSLQLVRRLDVITADGGGLYLNGSALAAAELTYIDGVTAGTATASKAVVLGTSKEIATITTATITTINNTTLNAGTVAFTAAGGYLTMGANASVVGSAIPLTSSKTSILRAYGDDGGAVIGAAAVRSGVFRFLNTVSQTAETSMFGAQGQFKIKAPASCTLTSGNRGGSWNYCELAGTADMTITLSGANKFTGGAFGMAEWDGVGSLTISASHIFGAFGALTNVVKGAGTFTRTGIFAAYSTMNNATASYSAFDYGMYMAAGSTTQAIYANCDVMGATGRIAQFYGTSANAALTDGYGAVEVDFTLSGTNTDHAAAFSSWVNIPTGTATAGTYICAQNNGVYEASAATITNAKIIFGMRAQKITGDTDGLCFPFSLNTSNTAITAVFDVNNATDMGWVDGVLSSATGDGHIPLFRDAAGAVHYVNTYTA